MDTKVFNNIIGKLYGLCIESQKLELIDMLIKFKQAQWLIINAITKIEASTDKAGDPGQKNKETRQILTLKDFANSIAWVMTGCTSSGLRAYYGAGGDSGYLRDKNIDMSLKIIREFENVEDGIILLTDITTTVNIGDILILKLGRPTMALELKEGEKNAQLLALLHDETSLEAYLNTLSDKERKTTQRHIQRLRNQHKRLNDLTEYLEDGSRRYDEYLDTHVQVVKQTLDNKTYSKSIQNAYGKMDERIRTLRLSDGLTILIAKSAYRMEDILYLKHTVYHRINHHRKVECVIKNERLGAEVIEKEMTGIMSLAVDSWMQNIGRPGYEPLTIAIAELSKELAIKILTCKVTLYIYMDVGIFIERLKQAGIQVQLAKPLGGSHQASALIVYEKKNVLLNGRSRLTAAFLDRILINFSLPKYEVAIQKELIDQFSALTDAEIIAMLEPQVRPD